MKTYRIYQRDMAGVLVVQADSFRIVDGVLYPRQSIDGEVRDIAAVRDWRAIQEQLDESRDARAA